MTFLLGTVLAALDAAFGDGSLRWYVFGGQALVVHGAPRATQDIDVTVDPGPSGLDAMMVRLEARGFRHRFPESAQELMEAGAVLPMVHLATGFDVDVVIAGSGLEQLFLERAERVCLAGIDVPVASATDLLVMKILAHRPRDLEDVRPLLARGRVDVAEARSLLEQLEEALGQSDLVPALEDAIRAVTRSRAVR